MWGIERIDADEAYRRAEFPVVAQRVFLAHAAVCPLPAVVCRAVQSYLDRASREDQEHWFARGEEANLRRRAAVFLGVEEDEVALIAPTSLGISMVAHGLPWRAGDNVVLCGEDFPSNYYPWLLLREQGVEIRQVRTPFAGAVEPPAVVEQMDGRTRLVALASGHFVSGFRIDPDAIGREVHARGALFCLDAIQTLGAMPTSLAEVDFAAADAHKWLLGPQGAGWLVVRRQHHELLRPVQWGWRNVRCPGYIVGSHVEYVRGAARYEGGSANFLGQVGVDAAAQALARVGIERVAARLLERRRQVVAGMERLGFETYPIPAARQSGIASFWAAGASAPRLGQRLSAQGIDVSVRSRAGGEPVLRVAPHFYNTPVEIDRFLDAVEAALPESRPAGRGQ